MAFTDKGDRNEEIEKTNDNDTKNQSPLDTPTTLQSSGKRARGFLDMFNVLSNRIYLLKFYSASAKFRRIAEQRDSTSRSVGSSSSGSHAFKERLTGVFSKKIDWVSLVKMSKEWIRNPINMALFAWITIVAISGAILFLVMTGMLNKAIPKKSQRDVWFEVNNQILNALFTLMCLYQHPKRFYHLTLLCRWNEKDIAKLRKIYCKNGTYKPHEWAHMLVVVILLHLNCFAQYALCGLNLGYRRSGRPAIGVGICISVAIAAPAFAGLYTIISPLGKDYESRPDDEEAQIPIADGTKRSYSLEKRYSFASRHEQGLIEEQPQWSGGILDIWDNISLSYLSLFCTFCVFGWNMERLGFGNMYVHIATFILFCMAPFWIFNLAAVNIDNEVVREALAIVGIILCGFGLLYGGFWRIQMRKRFNLPSYNFCFGRPAVSDCALWLCCCWCTLAQEVRTGNAYEVIEDKLLKKQTDNGDHPLLSPLPREDGVVPLTSTTGNSSTERMISRPDSLPKEYSSPGREVNDESLVSGNDDTMSPPVPSLVEKYKNHFYMYGYMVNKDKEGDGHYGPRRVAGNIKIGEFIQELANSQENPLELLEVKQKNQDVVLLLYEALKSRDVETVHKILASDLEWWFHGPPTHQFMMRLLTGSNNSDSDFQFVPLSITALGATVIAEGCDQSRQICWVHAWTVTDGIITQVREYFNTSLTVTRFGNPTNTVNGRTRTNSPSGYSTKTSVAALEINPVHCPSVWESSFCDRVGKSVPGLVLAI